jgi:hypothetical protein
MIAGIQPAVAGDALTNMGLAALARIFPGSMQSAVRSPECKSVVDDWIARVIGFRAAMQAFDGRPEQALLITQTGAAYCDAFAALTERVAAIVAQQDGAAQVKH